MAWRGDPMSGGMRHHSIPEGSLEDLGDAQEMIGLEEDSLDPEMHYRFVSERQARQARHRALGYRPVSRSEDGVKLTTDSTDGAAEDLIRVGDTILMCTPKTKYEGRRNRIDSVARARLEAPEGQFRKKAKAADANVTFKKMRGETEE